MIHFFDNPYYDITVNMPQVEYDPNPPRSREDFESDSNNGPGYTYVKHLDRVLQKDRGQKSTRTLIINLACEEEGSCADFIKHGMRLLREDMTSLNGEYGDLVINHVQKYLLDKYAMINPLRAKMIKKVMVGVPYSLYEDKDKIEALARFQQVYLQCISNWVEMVAAILCYEKDLEMSPREQYYEKLDITDPIYRPGPIVKRSAIELRFLLLTFEVQLDAKSILISEKRISPHARENMAAIEPLDDSADQVADDDGMASDGSGYDPHPESSDEEEEDAQCPLSQEKSSGPIEVEELVDYEEMEGVAAQDEPEIEAYDMPDINGDENGINNEDDDSENGIEDDDEDSEATLEFSSDSDEDFDIQFEDSGLGTEADSSAVLEDAGEGGDENEHEAEVVAEFHQGNLPV